MKRKLPKKHLLGFVALLLSFAFQAQAQYDAIVAQDGSGTYTTLRAALSAAPTGRTAPWVIFIKNGKYKEKDTIPSNKPFITLIGESVANVVISWNDYSGKAMPGGGSFGTGNSATFFVNASDFTAINITFENTTGESPQALAINVVGDRAAFKNCRFLGGQDTIFSGTTAARQYYRNCYIDGTVDFIFGDARAVFDSCYIYPKTRSSAGSSYITAANTKSNEPYGYVFRGCKILMNRGGSTYFLGRPWQNDAGTAEASKSWNKTIFLNTSFGNGVVRPEGWSTWDAGTSTGNITYAEYKNRNFNGALIDNSQRVSWSKQLTDAEAASYYNNSNLFGSWDPCSVYPGFCNNNQPELAVANLIGVRGASTTAFTWNASWPVSGVVYEVLRSTDNKATFTSVNSQTSTTDTAVNYSYSEAVPVPGATYYYLIRASKSGYNTTVSADTVMISSTPTVNVQGTLGSFLQGSGTPSNPQSYVVSASSLTNAVMITVPAGYELSTNGNTWNTNPISLNQDVNGNIANTTIYVRLNASSAGTYNGNITHASTGAQTVNLALTGTVQATPLTLSEVLQWHPMTTNGADSAAVRAVGVVGSTPTLSIFSVSDGVQYDAPPLPAYSPLRGQALSGSPGGTGDWRTASGGPGGTLTHIHYEQFTVTASSGYTLRLDSMVLNNSFYQSLNNTRIAVQYSLSNFVSDSAEISGGISGGTSLSFVTNGGFTKAVVVTQEDASTNNNYRFALNGATGVTVNAGQTVTVRIYFSCGSGSRNRYAKIKDLMFKGLSTKVPVTGDYRSYQTGVWNDVNTWETYDGTQWVHPAAAFPHYSNTTAPIIQNGHIVTLSATFTEGFGYIPRRTTINTGAQLVVNSGANMNVANDGSTPASSTTDLLVNGTLTVNGGIFTNGNVFIQVNGSFINNSTGMNLSNGGDSVAIGTNGAWEQKNNSSTTPARFYFEPSSTFRVTGLSTAQTNLFKTAAKYGNIVWNNAGESAYYGIQGTLDTSNVKGSFTVQNTGSTYLAFANTSKRLVLPGGFYQTGGTVNYRETGTITDTLDLGSDFSVTGGTFNSNMTVAGSSLMIRLNGLNKNLNYVGTSANNTNWQVNGNYMLGSNLTLPNAGYGINVNGTLNLGTSTVAGNGDFTVATNGIVITAATNGLDGNLSNTGAKTFNPNSAYIFNGTAAQTTGASFPATISGLTINNSAGITLTNGVAVNGIINLTSGLLTLGANNISAYAIAGGNNAQYVVTNGTGALKISNVGNMVFPVGPSGTKYNPVVINNTGAIDSFSVRVQDAIEFTPPTAKVVNKQWTITEEIAGNSIVTLSLSWTTNDQAAGFDPTRSVFISRYNGTEWVPTLASVSGSGTVANPYVATVSGLTSFSPFIVTNAFGALPLLFVNTKVYTKGSGVQVEWITASESNLLNYIVERSTDGISFTQVGLVNALNAPSASYAWFDASPNGGSNFYRIVAVENNNRHYTRIMKISLDGKQPQLIIGTNPVRGGVLNLQLSGIQKGIYFLNIYNEAGQQVYREKLVSDGSAITQVLHFPGLHSGMYSVQIINSSVNLTKRVLIDR